MLIRVFLPVVALIFAQLFTVTFSYASEFSAALEPKPLSLNVPEVNTNGMFVVKVSSELDASKLQHSVFELFRNFNGGRFERIESMPRYSSISQIVNKQGRYGYKAVLRVNGEYGSEVYETVSVSYIDVQLRNYGLMEKSKPTKKEVSKLLSQAHF